MLQLSHDDVANAPSSSSSAGASGVPGSNNPATEAVLLHTHYHHHRAGGVGGVGGVAVGGGPPHEWNFAKAFLYSLTVLTTIGKCQWPSAFADTTRGDAKGGVEEGLRYPRPQKGDRNNAPSLHLEVLFWLPFSA